MPDLLIELRSEEIPARMQARAAADFRRLMTDGMVAAGLTYAHAGAFAGPRRLTLAVEGLLAASPASSEERKGPRTDAPEAAVEGFLRSTGLSRAALEVRPDRKGAVYVATLHRPGRPAAEIVAEVLERTVRDFPWPKSMRWGAASATEGGLRWVRPLRAILAILHDETGAETVPVAIGGLAAGNTTVGHRVHAPEPFPVASFEDYAAKLKRARVLLSAEERADHILNDARQMAFAAGLDLVADTALLAEVAGLVEWPVVLMGAIDPAFLDLPAEVLQTSMREHQKFFSVRNPASGRIERFVTVANVAAPDDGATILAGNRKVLAARLSDAKFFWENDLRAVREGGLEGMARSLGAVTFHALLGSQGERIERVARLAGELAARVGADPSEAERAARVAKADLASGMVYEFPELQGVMGRYYAEAQGLSPAVARAAEAHYAPLGPSDAVPSEPVSVAVALADKIDTLTGFWAIDERPTGSKDPYALRRAALGVIRLLLENGHRMPLSDVVAGQFRAVLEQENRRFHARRRAELRRFSEQEADALSISPEATERRLKAALAAAEMDDLEAHLAAQELLWRIRFPEHARTHGTMADWSAATGGDPYPEEPGEGQRAQDDLLAFLHDRLKVHLREAGIRHDVLDACLAMPGNDDLTLLARRARALQDVLGTEDGANLIQGFRRANNILSQAEAADGVEYSFGPDPKLAETDAERALFAALDAAEARIAPAAAAEDFAAAVAAMAALRAPIDAFFEAVQVNAPNAVLRRNRLNLLHRIRATCRAVADLSRIEG